MLEKVNSEVTVYTIGHSNHTIEGFIDLLAIAGITAVADVRSMPYSRRMPHFCMPKLKETLKVAGIAYVFLGDQLGARPKDRSCYRSGTADYSLIAATQAFGVGLARVEDGAKLYKMALLCAEREPLDCHRTILVGRRLQVRGAAIRHVLADGTIEPNEDTERRLLERMNMQIGDLFGGPSNAVEAIAEAYEERGRQIAFTEERESADGMTHGATTT